MGDEIESFLGSNSYLQKTQTTTPDDKKSKALANKVADGVKF